MQVRFALGDENVSLASDITFMSVFSPCRVTQSRRSASEKRLIPGILTTDANRMNNNNGGNDANDNGDGHNAGQPETERQELVRLRREQELQRWVLLQEQAQLLLAMQQEQIVLEQAQLLEERV